MQTEYTGSIYSAAFHQVWLGYWESVEYISMDLEEYLAKRTGDPFIYEVKKYGEVLYITRASPERGP